MKPEIVVFDEATSHLDAEMERSIQHSLKSTLAGKTVILVAHRLSTIREAERIYVLDRGRVAETGSCAELLLHGGRFAALWNGQGRPEPAASGGSR